MLNFLYWAFWITVIVWAVGYVVLSGVLAFMKSRGCNTVGTYREIFTFSAAWPYLIYLKFC